MGKDGKQFFLTVDRFLRQRYEDLEPSDQKSAPNKVKIGAFTMNHWDLWQHLTNDEWIQKLSFVSMMVPRITPKDSDKWILPFGKLT